MLGLIGYGRVGSKVATRALGFGMSVLIYDPYIEKSKIESPGVQVTDLDYLLKNSDYVSLHARESKENENLLGEKAFSSMKQTAFFLNTARPSMVDEFALLSALQNGKLAGAAMDVLKYRSEPTHESTVESGERNSHSAHWGSYLRDDHEGC